MMCSKVTLALCALTGVVNGQCPGGKTGYSDVTCAITQDAQLDAPMLGIVQAVSDFKAAIGSAGTADDPATADVDESTPATWDFAGAMTFYTANLQVRYLPCYAPYSRVGCLHMNSESSSAVRLADGRRD